MRETQSTNSIQELRRAYGTDGWCSSYPGLLVIEPEPAAKLKACIGWLRDDVPENRCEQGGILIGTPFYNREGACIGGVVSHLLMADAECRQPAYIEWSAYEDLRLQREFYRIRDTLAETDPEGSEKLHILGWWHTHPNGLPVFMSGTDMETQRLKYGKPWHFSLVLNPHRGIFRAFRGAEAEEVPAILLLNAPAGTKAAPPSPSAAVSDKSQCEPAPAAPEKKKPHSRHRRHLFKRNKKCQRPTE